MGYEYNDILDTPRSWKKNVNKTKLEEVWKSMKRISYYLIIILSIFLLIACKNKDKDKDQEDNETITEDSDDRTPSPTPTKKPEVTPTEIPEDENREGEMRSNLTGQWVPLEIGSKRPLAIQFNNFKTVKNQWGIGQADILYEAITEGGITRLLGIGENFTGDKIGSIRSSRHYFVSIADEYDAIYVHYGKTKYAKSKLSKLDMDNLDGETGIGTVVFYRDKSLKAPHNAFTSLDRIQKGIKQKKYSTEHRKDFEPHFNFYKEDTDLDSSTVVNKITIDFSNYTTPYLEYNAEDKLYYRYQFGGPHKDSVTGEQLTFKNILVQFVNEYDIDKNDYQTIDWENASGSAYYITNGKMVPVTWKKNETKKWMRFYDEAGNELTINPGKTYIAIFPDRRPKDVILE